MSSIAKTTVVGLMLAVLAGCNKQVKPDDPYYAPVTPQALQTPQVVTGSIYSAASARDLYGDGRANRVGDIITVVLTESTQSSKSAKTAIDKESTFNLPQPTVFGHPARAFGQPLSLNATTSSEFDGEGSSDMNNSLNGNIAVTVHEVLPNGTLVVRGEKWLTLNQGDEYIRVSGMVRPQDIGADNSVPSTKLANARIAYSGTGAVHDSNVIGWLAKFFVSPLWPF